MCDFFAGPVSIEQATPRLQFASFRTTEGLCAPPGCTPVPPACSVTSCPPRACVDIVFDGDDLAAIASAASDASDLRCRFEVSTVEGESLDIVLKLAGSSSMTFCCCGGPGTGGCNARLVEHVWYGWAISVNGVELGKDRVVLPAVWDGGMPFDGGAPSIDAPAYD